MEFNHREEHVDEHMLIIQANYDDMNPEYTGYVMDKLFERGANDVYWVPIIMKKGRPGFMLNVLVHESLLAGMEEIIFTETTTLGLRYMRAACHRLGRSIEKVETAWGSVGVKAGYHQGKMVQFSPEYRDCEKAAKEHGVPLKTVYEEVRRQFAGKQEGGSAGV